MPAIRHRHVFVEGIDVFDREAGDPANPTLVLLPGFPSSSRAYIRLIDRLADNWHAVAIDYPGFGSSEPLLESPTFDRLAEITASVIDALGLVHLAKVEFVGAKVSTRADYSWVRDGDEIPFGEPLN